MNHDILRAEREHLSKLLEAIQRCVFFLHQTQAHLEWPLSGEHLETHKKDLRTFESLAALNERFAKLQDTLASAMRHSALLMSEPTDSFLKVLALFEKLGVIDSIDTWQLARTARNLAAHDYEIDYDIIAEHFNTLHELSALLNATAHRLLETCRTSLNIEPISDDFAAEFASITQPQNNTAS